MHKLTRALVAGILASVLLVSATAHASTPQGGTLSKSKRSLSWSGPTWNYAIPWPDASVFCTDGQCDHFKLKINMGEGARIKVTVKATPTPVDSAQDFGGQGVAPNDVDLFIYDPNGVEVGESATPHGTESVTFTHKGKFRNKAYDVEVSPWLVLPGATYSGMAVTLSYVK